MVELQHFSSEASPEQMLEAFRSDGTIIIEYMMDRAMLEALRAESNLYMDTTENDQDEFTGRLNSRIGGLISHFNGVCDLVEHKTLLALS